MTTKSVSPNANNASYAIEPPVSSPPHEMGMRRARGPVVGQLLAVGIFWTTDSLGEAIQLHGVLGVGAAVPLALWALIGRSDGWFGRFGGILLGSTTALAWLFGLFVAIEYYPLGNAQLLPIVRIVADILALV